MSHIHLTKEDVIGAYEWKGKLDLLNIVMIGLGKELPGHDEKYGLHRLLGALLSQELTAQEKLKIMGTEYHIPLEANLRKDVSEMCNLSQGIEEKGIALGEARGRAEIILKLHQSGFTAEQIAAVTDQEVEEVEGILSGKAPILA